MLSNITNFMVNSNLLEDIEYDSTSSGSYSIPENCNALLIQAQGAGAGAGGAAINQDGGNIYHASGAGGGSGGYISLFVFLDSNNSLSDINYSVGSGGIGGSSTHGINADRNTGTSGTDTTFGSLLTAVGAEVNREGGRIETVDDPDYGRKTEFANTNIIDSDWSSHTIIILQNVPGYYGGRGAQTETSPGPSPTFPNQGSDGGSPLSLANQEQFLTTPGTSDTLKTVDLDSWCSGGGGAASWHGHGGHSGTCAADSDNIHGNDAVGFGSGGGGGSTFGTPGATEYSGTGGNGAGGFLRIQSYKGQIT